MTVKKDTFNFWFPIDLVKSEKTKDGKKSMRISGIASTNAEDSDGEILIPQGFDLTYFNKSGFLNWNHGAKNSPASIIGEPIQSKVTKDGLYVEGLLYDTPLAREVYDIASVLEASSETGRRLGFSIEGKALEKDEKDPRIIKKAKITGIAITHVPKNPKTLLQILKGEVEDQNDEEEEEDEKNKSLSTDQGSGGVLKKESVEGVGSDRSLTKSEIYEKILSDVTDIDFNIAKEIHNLIKSISTMKKGENASVTMSDIEKAYISLGIKKSENAEEDNSPKYSPFLDEDGIHYRLIEKSEDGEEIFSDDVRYSKEGERFVADGFSKAECEEISEEEAEKYSRLIKSKYSSASPKAAMQEDDDDEEEDNDTEEKSSINKSRVEDNGIMKSISDDLQNLIKVVGDVSQRIEKSEKSIEEIANNPFALGQRKSITRATERFPNNEISKGGESSTLSCSNNRKQVLEVLEKMTFEKGYDDQLGQALTQFESTGFIEKSIQARILKENNILIVQ